MKKTVYYDYNAFLQWKDGKNAELTFATALFRAGGFILLYSPAHVEEIACIPREDKNDDETANKYVNEHLNALSCFSKDWEIVPDPSTATGISIIQELPIDCWYKRVVNDYGLNYVLEKARLETKRKLPPSIVGKQQILNILSTDDAALLIEKHLGEIHLTLEDVPIGKLHQNRDLCLKVVSVMYGVLAELGYKRESEQKVRSEMLDICHSIYAAQCDYFITDDKKFREKIREIYRFLDIPTQIMTTDEWIKYGQC